MFKKMILGFFLLTGACAQLNTLPIPENHQVTQDSLWHDFFGQTSKTPEVTFRSGDDLDCQDYSRGGAVSGWHDKDGLCVNGLSHDDGTVEIAWLPGIETLSETSIVHEFGHQFMAATTGAGDHFHQSDTFNDSLHHYHGDRTDGGKVLAGNEWLMAARL